MNREVLLAEAHKAVSQDRAAAYGDLRQNFTRIARLWSVIFGIEVTVEQVALGMDAVKTARLIGNPSHQDSWMDKAGYAALGGELSETTTEEGKPWSRAEYVTTTPAIWTGPATDGLGSLNRTK